MRVNHRTPRRIFLKGVIPEEIWSCLRSNVTCGESKTKQVKSMDVLFAGNIVP